MDEDIEKLFQEKMKLEETTQQDFNSNLEYKEKIKDEIDWMDEIQENKMALQEIERNSEQQLA